MSKVVQTTLSVALEVKPASYTALCARIDALQQAGDATAGEFAPFMASVDSVHFMSMSVFPAADYDPLFVLEVNVDGPVATFWQKLEHAIGGDLRAMIRCCKRPLDRDGPLYDAVTRAEGPEPVARYLAARAGRPSVFHHGNRGLSRERIVAERALFRGARAELARADAAGGTPYRGADAATIHARLREALLPDFTWLAQSGAARVTTMERVADAFRLAAFVVALVILLALPGLLIATVASTGRFLLLVAALLVALLGLTAALRGALPGTATPGSFPWAAMPRVGLLIGGGLLAGFAIVAPFTTVAGALLSGTSVALTWPFAARAALLGLASVVFVILPGIILWLRWLERRDSSHEAPPVEEATMRQMAQREDWIPQSHMASVVMLKPGLLRTIVVHAGHRALGLVLRWKATDGYLGSMRTVHFAHWAFANNGARLLFFSNFDQSWESYLDDFIEKAHEGLTLAWGCGVGFPPTRFLVRDGASHGRMFKAWARHSMTISRFWYSAYPDLTVDQIERNWRVATGLRRMSLNEKEAAEWIADL